MFCNTLHIHLENKLTAYGYLAKARCLLWVNMMRTGARCANVDDYLVYARTGTAMIDRRGGWAYFKKYRSGRQKIYAKGYISWWDYFVTLAVQLVVSLLPKGIRRYVFEKMLRK